MREKTIVNISNSFFELINSSSILVPGGIGNKRPVLSSWHKAYQKRTLSVDSEVTEKNYQRAIGASSFDHNYPLALRPDPTLNHHSDSSSLQIKTCDTAGYLELIHNPNDNLIGEEANKNLLIDTNTHSYVYIPSNTLTISSVFLGALIIILIWHFKQKQTELLRQQSMTKETSSSSSTTTPEYHQLQQSLIPSFQSR
jgi:hypothetical protein